MRDTPQQRTIAFDSGHLNLRGTDVAMFDYADCAETLLGHRSLILAPAESDLSALDRFRRRFPIGLYRSLEDRQRMIADVDLYYLQELGNRPETLPPRPPHGQRAVHCVFTADQPYGEIYAGISDWVASQRGPSAADGLRPPVPSVPYMVRLPASAEHLRDALEIPADAVVLGRHGGTTTFNLPWVADATVAAVQRRADLHLLFLNTPMFVEHPRVHFLAGTHDLEEKRIFINTCDAMLHAREEGETFGLAVAEFSICNKPVITWSGGFDRHHIEVLGNRGIYYHAPADLLELLLTWQPEPERDWDAFSSRFAPEPVMEQFSRVFLGEQRQLHRGSPRQHANLQTV